MKEILKKIMKFIADKKLYIITFIVSSLIISVLYVSQEVTPFGKKSLLCVDFYHQYGPMLGEYFDRIKNGKQLIYSFSMGGGSPFFMNFLNYMSSPFNLLILLFSKKNLVTSYSFVIGLKAIISSCTFLYFISHKFKTKELSIIPLGILYAFSAYYASYYWNIMWLDGMVFLPLITLGIEYIIKEGKWRFYSIFLAIMLISNYFIGYMICIFSVLYFIIFNIHEFYVKKGETKKNTKIFFRNCLLFGLGSLTAGMLAAVFLIPLASSLNSISATGGTWPKAQYYAFTLKDFLKYHLTGVSTTTFASDTITAPNISAGILSVGLLFLFIFNMEIPHKTKICYLLLLGLFVITFFNVDLDFIIQAFHVPNDLPYRYSFIYTFILLTIAAYALMNIKKMPYLLVVSTYVFIMLLLLSISKDNYVSLSKNMIYSNMIIITLYFIFYSGMKWIKDLKTAFVIALIIAASIDCVTSIAYNWDITQILEVFYQEYDDMTTQLQNIRNSDNTPFYRIADANTMTYNDSSWYGYNGITTFSSMAYENVAKYQSNLGLASNYINSYTYVQTTPIYDLMFNIKYVFGETNDKNRYKQLTTDYAETYEFNYGGSIGYGALTDMSEFVNNEYDPFEMHNKFIETTTGVSDVLEKLQPDFVTELYNDSYEYVARYEYKNPHDNMYFYTNDYNVDFAIIGNCLYNKNNSYVNFTSEKGIVYDIVDDYHEERIINISSQDDMVYIDVAYNTTSPFNDSFYVYAINQEKFEEAYKILQDNKIEVSEFKENVIKGFITTEYEHVYTSISYDEGWKVYVDGKQVDTYKIADAMLGFDITPGNHEVVFKYKIKGLNLGIITTITGITILFIPNIYKFIKKKKKKNYKKIIL